MNGPIAMNYRATGFEFLGFERDECITRLHLMHDPVDDLLE